MGEFTNASLQSEFDSALLYCVTLCPLHCRFMFCEQDYFSQVLCGRGSE